MTAGQRTTIYRAADPAGGPAFPSSATITLRSDQFGSDQLPSHGITDARLAKTITALPVLGRSKLSLNVDDEQPDGRWGFMAACKKES